MLFGRVIAKSNGEHEEITDKDILNLVCEPE